ncbi:MAG: VanW family protein [Acidimicrobiia bacterium]
MVISRSRTILFTAVPVLLLMFPLSIYFMDSAAASDKVARNVTIEGVDVSRYTEDEAQAAAEKYAAELQATPASVEVNGQSFDLDPVAVGLTFGTEAAVDMALEQRKGGITDWLRAFSEGVDVPVTAALDPDLLEAQLREWEQAAIPNPAFEGTIAIVNREVRYEYPSDGEAIDRDVAEDLLLAALSTGSDEAVVLPTAVTSPVLTKSDIDEAVAEAERILRTTVVLTQDEYDFTLRIDSLDISRSLDAAVTLGNPPTIEFFFDRDIFVPLIEGVRTQLELAPQDAYWETVVVDDHESWDENYEIKDSEQSSDLPDDDAIRLIPAKSGTTIDVDAVAAAIEEAARTQGSGELPIVLNAPAAFTTEMAESFGDLYEVSEFTTYMPGTNRAHNIKLMADLVDGTVVMPGETFSVNELIGRRTLEKGFKYDCAIVSGELSCEEDPVNVGGGVSQFGTTIFNAIYFGCYKDVVHQPHSIYFTKYPEGREATLGYPSPDVAFENDSDAPVIIRTSYTRRSVTVTFFGNQNGHYCGTQRSERTGVASPVTEYQADDENIIKPGQEYVKSKGSKGWSVTNTRIFYDAEGNELDREAFYWRYRGEKNVIVVHPCDERVGGNGQCPAQVPGVTGMAQGAASAALAEAGFGVAVVTVDTDDESLNGIVISADPTGWLDPGETVTITVGNYTGGGGGDGGGGEDE